MLYSGYMNSTNQETNMNNKPKIGQIVKVHGQDCRIFKIHPFGTIDVVTLDGSKSFRMSGLAF